MILVILFFGSVFGFGIRDDPGPAFSSDARVPARGGGHGGPPSHVCDPVSAAGEDVCGDYAGTPASS